MGKCTKKSSQGHHYLRVKEKDHMPTHPKQNKKNPPTTNKNPTKHTKKTPKNSDVLKV